MSLSGAQAVARAISDARCDVITHVPGYGASEVYEASRAGRVRATLSYHEEVAYAVGYGAALCGARTAVVIKKHGLAKAANAVQSSLAAGVTAGLVIVVADDREGLRSDTIFGGEAFFRGLELPCVTADANGVYDAVFEAFIRSEQTSLPQAVLIDASDLVAPLTTDLASRRLDLPPLYQRDVARHLVCPLFTKYQLQVLRARQQGRSPDEVPRPVLPTVPDGLPAPWQPTLRDYRVFFDALRTVPRDFTSGDTGLCSLFGFPPYEAVDAVSYYGGAVPLAIGAWLAGREQAWALCGDFAFVAGGPLGLLEASHRHAPLKVVVFNNGRAEATGGQPLLADDLHRALAPWEGCVHRVEEGRDPLAVRFAIDEAVQKEGLRIIVLSYP